MNNETTVNLNLIQSEIDYVAMSIFDNETEEELDHRILPTGMAIPAKGDIISISDINMSGKLEDDSEVGEILSESPRYEVVHRRLNYNFHEYDFDDEDLEEGVSLQANIWVTEQPIDDEGE